jgi:hypothetical protein
MDHVQYLATAIGNGDTIGTAVSHSPEGVLEVLESIRATPGVRSVESWTHLRVVKESYSHVSTA